MFGVGVRAFVCVSMYWVLLICCARAYVCLCCVYEFLVKDFITCVMCAYKKLCPYVCDCVCVRARA